MNVPQSDLEHPPFSNAERSTQRLPLPGSDLEHLSISDLESLLAEKRRRESKRLLRTIAGRAPGEAPAPRARVQPPGLQSQSPPPSRKITRRLMAEEVRAALGRPNGAASRMRVVAPPPADRFRRSSLASPIRARPQRGPAWLRQASVRKGIDLGLQLAEIAFVVLFLYVIAQWLFTDSQVDTNIAAEMAPVEVPAGDAPPSLAAPKEAAAPSLAVPAAAQSGAPGAARPAAPGGARIHEDGGPPLAGSPLATAVAGAAAGAPANTAQATHNDLIQERRGLAGSAAPPMTLNPATTTITDTMSGTAGTPAPDPAAESNPALATEIRIPRIKLDARVREVEVRLDTWEWEVADFMAGHHTGTANPGETGNVVIAGHRDIRGMVFLHLDELRKGDDIYLYSGRGIFHYVVRTTKIVRPTAVEVMAPTTDQRLTLITCTPVKIASHRLIIIADLDPNYVPPDRGK